MNTPLYDKFRIHLDQQFIIPEVEQKFQSWFELQDYPYESMVSILNNAINSADIPGLSNQLVEQNNTDMTKRSYAGTTVPYNKKLSLSFKIQNNYFSYFLMRQLLLEYVLRSAGQTEYFLPSINLDVLDDLGGVIYKINYTDIVYESISGITFKKTDVGVSYREFTCNFRYNNYYEQTPDMMIQYSNVDNIKIY